ncbi:MAG: hypothetical protein ACF8AM_13160, partial [Rhodopirellula sp. JB055]|uniref:hypothetical protein n=1 Tax=Rhodopirellula sp. JB055 TaxID=3342846 RepID=UPI00370AAAFE
LDLIANHLRLLLGRQLLLSSGQRERFISVGGKDQRDAILAVGSAARASLTRRSGGKCLADAF